jgi:class 3 adenylate cyclase/PAS domain-containing protein
VSTICENQMLEPLEYFSTQSLLHSDGYIMMSLDQFYSYAHLRSGAVNPSRTPVPAPPPTATIAPASIGGSWELKDMIAYWSRHLTSLLPEFSRFQSIETTNQYLSASQDLLFDPITNLTFYDGGTASSTLVPVPIGYLNTLNYVRSLAEETTLNWTVLDDPSFLNPQANVPILGKVLSQSLSNLVEYMVDVRDGLSFTTDVVVYTGIATCAALYLLTQFLQVRWINANKARVYSALLDVPKNHLSAMIDTLRLRRVRTKQETTSGSKRGNDQSKQDDTVMKTFVAGGGSSSARSIEVVLMVFAMGVDVALFCVAVFLTNWTINEQLLTITNVAPHLTYIHAMWANSVVGTSYAFQMFFINDPDWPSRLYDNSPGYNGKRALHEAYVAARQNSLEMCLAAQFGDSARGIAPYQGYAEASALAATKVTCSDDERAPVSFSAALSCASPTLILELWQSALRALVVYFTESNLTTMDWDERISTYWSYLQYPVFSLFIDPMFNDIGHVIDETNSDLKASMYAVVIVLMVIAVIVHVLAIANLLGIDKHMRSVLHFLQHCPSGVVLKSPRIMAIVNGDFSSGARSDSKKSPEFFRTVIEQMPDAVILCVGANHVITTANTACERLFGERHIGEPIDQFLGHGFEGDMTALQESFADKKEGNAVQCVFHKTDGEAVNIECTAIPMDNTLALIFRDITPTIRYNTLIAAEQDKSDQLLRSILPPSLVGRVQAGEKNISFAVASATICFIDIVSFTPWCGASQAEKVMMTLNSMFKKFDSNCNNYNMMTRIKCIGDCYMGAGGVFAEVNQPAQHAKQVVSFGIDCLDSVEELNHELGEKLQIRVGVNTGGPIVAGVLGGIGSGKPTFEILGPAINMAQQMEHHGVPGQVHISRQVYELIYGGEFKVAERGSIEVKGGSVVTYLVTGRQASHK